MLDLLLFITNGFNDKLLWQDTTDFTKRINRVLGVLKTSVIINKKILYNFFNSRLHSLSLSTRPRVFRSFAQPSIVQLYHLQTTSEVTLNSTAMSSVTKGKKNRRKRRRLTIKRKKNELKSVLSNWLLLLLIRCCFFIYAQIRVIKLCGKSKTCYYFYVSKR